QPHLPASATPASLIGLSDKELTSLLGTPAWTRRETPAEVWQYRGTTCVVDKPIKDRKSTRLNSSHRTISYAVFCLKKKKPTLRLAPVIVKAILKHLRPLNAK